jgi:hypothetical protein
VACDVEFELTLPHPAKVKLARPVKMTNQNLLNKKGFHKTSHPCFPSSKFNRAAASMSCSKPVIYRLQGLAWRPNRNEEIFRLLLIQTGVTPPF